MFKKKDIISFQTLLLLISNFYAQLLRTGSWTCAPPNTHLLREDDDRSRSFSSLPGSGDPVTCLLTPVMRHRE